MNAANGQLEDASSSCEWWEWGCAGLVVAAVVAEFIIAGIHPLYDSFLEQWGLAIADAAIALGILGEVLFSRKDANIQSELRRRSNERAATLEKEAAEARERTALLEKITAFREISPNQRQQISDAIRDKVSPKIHILIEWERGDTEAYLYAWQISNIFRDAGVDKIQGTPNTWLNWQGFGVWMNADKSFDLPAVAGAFAEAGVVVNVQDREAVNRLAWGPRWGNPLIALYVFVAPKMPPGIEKLEAPIQTDATTTNSSAIKARE